jgi:hypothetical protein
MSVTSSSSSVFEGLVAIKTEVETLLAKDWKNVLVPLGVIVTIHVLVQYVLPRIFGSGIYDFLGRRKKLAAAGCEPDEDTRAALAIDMRTKIIGGGVGLYVTLLGLYGMWVSPELETDPYGSTPLSWHLMRVAVSFFVWDLGICVLDRLPLVWYLHGFCCFCVYSASLRPFLHYMGFVTLVFEASTPFLHIRKGMIDAGKGSGTLFTVAQGMFALTFFASRILLGYWKCWGPGMWNTQMEALLESGNAHIPAVVRMYQVNCVVLSALNAYWMFDIIRLGLGFGGAKGKAQKDKATKKEA